MPRSNARRPAERLVYDLCRMGIPEVPMLGWYRYTRAHSGLPPHAHPETLEICYLATGRQTYRAGRRIYHLKGGDVFVTQPGEEHDTGMQPEEKSELYWVQLVLPRRGKRFFLCTPAESTRLVRALRSLHLRHFPGSPALKQSLGRLFAACRETANPLRRVAVRNHLLDFLLGVLRCARQSPPAQPSARARDLAGFIRSNLDQPLPLRLLAKRARLSLPRLKASFRKETGIPPAEYVLRCRVDQAKTLLAKPGASVTGVAMDLGFSTSQYFATAFRRITGRSPSEFLPPRRRRPA